jgi:hypothetical protein
MLDYSHKPEHKLPPAFCCERLASLTIHLLLGIR